MGDSAEDSSKTSDLSFMVKENLPDCIITVSVIKMVKWL